jgi:hypothetical protein
LELAVELIGQIRVDRSLALLPYRIHAEGLDNRRKNGSALIQRAERRSETGRPLSSQLDLPRSFLR